VLRVSCLKAQADITPRISLTSISRLPVVCAILLAALTLHLYTFGDTKQAADKRKTVAFKLPLWLGGPVTDAHRQPLAPESLQVLNGKAALPVSGVMAPETPTMLLVAFDTVGDINNITQARKAVIAEINSLGSQYWVGLISAQEPIEVLQEPTPDRSLLQSRIEALSQIGKAGLLESMQPIADMATNILLKADVRVAVVFITDSDIGNYRADYLNPPVNTSDSRDLSRRFAGRALQEKISRMTAALARFQAPIFIVHIDPGLDSLNRAYHNGLKQLAEAVGGQCLLSKTTGDIQPTIREAFKWVKSFYVVGFSLTAEKSGYVRIEIRPAAAIQLAPRFLYPSRVFFP